MALLRPLRMRGFGPPRLSFVDPAGVLRLSAVVLLALLLPTVLGWLQPLQTALAAVMRVLPLPRLYLPLFVAVGTLLPLAVRIGRRRNAAVRRVLDPYLLLLLGQLLSELVVVLAGGKGLGVLVGSTFTLLRLVQLRRLWPLADTARGLRPLLLALALLWSINAAQMLIRRWLALWIGVSLQASGASLLG